jgi:hypothetical protein
MTVEQKNDPMNGIENSHCVELNSQNIYHIKNI